MKALFGLPSHASLLGNPTWDSLQCRAIFEELGVGEREDRLSAFHKGKECNNYIIIIRYLKLHSIN
jgi:hypothetical protein